jgi:O-antigen/teichoic acid export membrane protein
LNKLKRFLATGGIWSMSDQAVVSLGNFLLTVTLARYMSKTEYGVYVVTLGAFLVGNAIHSGLLAYPISVLGAHIPDEEIHQYAANGLLVTYAFALPVAAVLGTTIWALSKNRELALAVIAAMFCWQTHETLRRCLMSRLRHGVTIFGDAVTYLGQIALVVFLAYRHSELVAQTGFLIIALASLVGALVHLSVIGLRYPNFTAAIALGRESIKLGRWSLFSILGYWGTVSLLPWALALKSLAEVANYQTMMNVVQVVNPVMFSVSNLVVPSVAHEMKKPDGEKRALRVTLVHMLQGMVLLAPLFLGLLIVPGPVMRALYGHARGYAENDAVMKVLVFGAILTYTGHILNAYFLGRKSVEIVGRSQVAATITAAICAIALIPKWDLMGAAMSFVAMGIARNGLLIAALRQGSSQEVGSISRDLRVEVSPIPPTDGI